MARTGTAAATSSTTSSGARPPVATVTVATSAYSGARAASRVRSVARGLRPSTGRLRPSPTRSAAEARSTSSQATVPRALATVDVATGEPAVAINQRSDACAVPRGSVVMEAMVALVLADAALEKFGGDSVPETRRNARAYLDALAIR